MDLNAASPPVLIHGGTRRKLASQAISGVEKVPLTTTKLGGQLEPFADVSKGYRCAKPLGWNRYDGTAGEYVVKMVDLVDPTQVILITNSPVKSETEVFPHIFLLVWQLKGFYWCNVRFLSGCMISGKCSCY